MTTEEYLDFLRSRGRKETTLMAYRISIGVCEACLSDGGYPTDPKDITEDSMFYLRSHLRMKETSMQTRMRAFSQYVEWYTSVNHLKKAKVLWNPLTYDVVTITKDDFSSLLCFSFFVPHFRMMLLLGGLMGLRRTEMASIKMNDLRGDAIRIHGKGHGEEGNVQNQHIPSAMRSEIARYLEWRMQKLEEDGISTDYFLIFTSRHGKVSLPKNRLEAISWWFQSISKKSGITVTPHSLRRLYATTLYESGIDIKTVSKLMRHANPMVTWNYIHQKDRALTESSDSIVASLELNLNIA